MTGGNRTLTRRCELSRIKGTQCQRLRQQLQGCRQDLKVSVQVTNNLGHPDQTMVAQTTVNITKKTSLINLKRYLIF